MNASLDLALSLLALVACGFLFVLANRKAAEPPIPMRPLRVPWRFVIILSAFGAFLILIHLVNLAGVQTGPDASPSRFP